MLVTFTIAVISTWENIWMRKRLSLLRVSQISVCGCWLHYFWVCGEIDPHNRRAQVITAACPMASRMQKKRKEIERDQDRGDLSSRIPKDLLPPVMPQLLATLKIDQAFITWACEDLWHSTHSLQSPFCLCYLCVKMLTWVSTVLTHRCTVYFTHCLSLGANVGLK